MVDRFGVVTAAQTLHHVEELAGSDYHMQTEIALATLIVENERIQRHYLLHQWGTLRNFNVIDPLLTERSAQRITQIGRARVRLINARHMVQIVLQCLRANPRMLCQP